MMRWLGKIFLVVICCAILLAVFNPGAVAVSAIVLAEKIAIVWCVANFFAEVVSGRSIISWITKKER